MRERLVRLFPFAIALLLPVAGVAIAAVRLSQGARRDAALLLLAALVGLGLISLLIVVAG